MALSLDCCALAKVALREAILSRRPALSNRLRDSLTGWPPRGVALLFCSLPCGLLLGCLLCVLLWSAVMLLLLGAGCYDVLVEFVRDGGQSLNVVKRVGGSWKN